MRWCTPDSYWKRLSSVPYDFLEARHIRLVMLDRDNTCTSRADGCVPEDILTWVRGLQERGIQVCLISNNYHVADLERTARELQCRLYYFALKPLPHMLRRAMYEADVSADEALMIGDQLFTDVCAGRLARVETLLVQPLSRKDLWYTHLFRLVEQLLLAHLPCEDDES